MTENEALYILNNYKFDMRQNGAFDMITTISFVTNALKELQHYREIGTVEECQEAAEKQKPKKPKEILRHRAGFETHHCPNCNTDYQTDNRYTLIDSYCPSCGKLLDSVFGNYCGNCGRAICWEESEEE